MMSKSNAEEAKLSAEMMVSCCSMDTGRSGAADAVAAASSARTIKLMDGGLTAEGGAALSRAALVC